MNWALPPMRRKPILGSHYLFTVSLFLFAFAPQSNALMMADTIVIAEVNPNDGAANTEFIVLYNPTPDTVTFPAGFRLRFNGGTSRALTNPYTSSIGAFSFYKVARPNTTADSDAYFGTATGEAALDSSSAAMSWDGATWVDKVSWGAYTGSDFEDSRGTVIPLSTGKSIARNPDTFQMGGASIDSNSNQFDFSHNVTRISKNRTSPRERVVFHVSGPASVTLGTPFTLRCTAVVSTSGTTYNDSVVTSYTGPKAWGNISVSSGSITPDTTGASGGFTNGVRSLSVTITGASDPVVITVADGYCTGFVSIPVASTDTPNAATRVSPAHNHETDVIKPQFYWIHNDTSASPQAKYHIQFSTSSTFTSIAYEETVTTTQETVTLNGALSYPADSTLYWRVQTSSSGDILSPWASGDSIIIVHLRPPSKPVLTSPSDNLDTIGRAVRFSWTHVDSDASAQESFTIQISKQTDFSSIWAQDTQSTSNEYYETTFPSLSDTYYWRVATRDKIAFGAWSDTRKLVQADTIPIVVISEICVGSSDSDFVELFVTDDRNFNQGADLTGWRLYTTTTGAPGLRKTFGSLASIKESSFVTIYFATTKTDETTDGTDSRVNLYTTATNATLPTGEGLVQLLSHRTADTRDVIPYSDQATLSNISEQLTNLVTVGRWSPDATAGNTAPCTGLSENGNALRRDGAFTDANTKNDWTLDSQTGGNYPLARFYVSSDSATPYSNAESFGLRIFAIDGRNDTIIGARFRPEITIAAGTLTNATALFKVDHSDFNSGDTICTTGIIGTSGNRAITFTSNGCTGSVTVNVQTSLDHFEITAPVQAVRDSDFLLRLRAMDASGVVNTGFTGAVTLTVTQGTITPSSRTFIASENGDTTFLCQLNGVGAITVTATANGKTGTTAIAPLKDTSFSISEFMANDTNVSPSSTRDRDEFVEIRNSGHGPVNIGSYSLVIAPSSTNDTYTFPSLSVPAGRMVVVHFNQSGNNDINFADTDGAAHLYAINSSPAMTDFQDAIPHSSVPWALGLYAPGTQDSSTIVDFVGVDGGATSDPSLKDTDAVDGGIWTNDATLNQPTTAGDHEGRSFYRITDGVDSNGISSSEWSTIAVGGGTARHRFTEGCTNVNAQPGGTVSIALATTSSPTGDTFVAGDTLHITLTSTTDGNASARNSTNVRVYATDTDETGIIVTLVETANNSMIFVGEARASLAPMQSNDGMRIIKAEPNDTLTVSWVVSASVATSISATGTLDHFNISPSATTINQGDQVDLRVIAKDAGDFTITSFTGTVTITASDSIVYPSSWNITSPDNGDTTAKIIFGAGPGTITCTVTSGSKTGTTTIEILADTNYLLNEILPAPRGAGGIDWNGDGSFSTSDEWIELFNKGTTSLSLNGYGLAQTGDASPQELRGSIPAKGYVTVYTANGSSYHFDSMGVIVDTNTGLGGSFSLTNTGGTVELRRASDSAVIAAVTFPDQGTNRDSSYGRGPDGKNAWYTYKKASPGLHPTPATDNVSNPNAVFQVDAPATATVGSAFTLKVALLARNGDTQTSFGDTASLRVAGTGALNATQISFVEGVASASVQFTSGTAGETAGIYAEIQGAIQGVDSVLIAANGVSRETSQVNVEQAIADGFDTAVIQVVVQNAASSPLSGIGVTISSSKGASDTISHLTDTTNSAGVCSFTVKSLSTTASRITVVADGLTLYDSPIIYWLDPNESGVSTTFGTQITIHTTDDDSHMILFPVWRPDGQALAYVAKTAAVDTWNIYVVFDDGAHNDGAANDGTFSSRYQVTSETQNVFHGSKPGWGDFLDASGNRVALGAGSDGTYDIIYSGNNGAGTRNLYVVRAEAQDSRLRQESTVVIASGGGTWSMPTTTTDTDAMYAINNGSVYRLWGKGVGQKGPTLDNQKILVGGSLTEFAIDGINYAAADIAFYNKNIMAVSLVNNKTGSTDRNKRAAVILCSGVDTAGLRAWTTLGTDTCRLVKRADTNVAWNLSWDTTGRALSFARDISGNFNWSRLWNRVTMPENAYGDVDFDVEVTYVTDTLFTPNYPASLISNKKGMNDQSATFAPSGPARVGYASYDTVTGVVKLNVVDIDGVTEVNDNGGLLFQNGRLTAIVDEGDLIGGSIQLKVARPTAAPSNPTPESIALTGTAHEFSPHGTTFADSITVIIYYDAADLAAAGITNGTDTEYTLRVFYYDPNITQWIDYHAVVDPTDRSGALGSLTFQTNHFSTFGVGVEHSHPNQPTRLAPDSGTIVTTTRPQFAWVHSDPQNRAQIAFRLEISEQANFNPVLVADERQSADTSITLASSLPAGESTLYWRVRTGAVSNGFGAWSSGDSTFQTRIRLPLAPTLLSPDDGAETRVSTPRFRWIHNDPDSDLQTRFRIELASDTSFTSLAGVFMPDTSSSDVLFPESLADTTYYWRLKTDDGSGFGAWSGSRRLMISSRPASPLITTAPDSISSPFPVFRWTHVDSYGSPQTGYRFRASLDSGFGSSFVDLSVATTETSVTLSGDTQLSTRGGRQVYFRISTASDGLNFGPEASGSFLATLNPPNSPVLVGPAAGAALAGNITFQWQHRDSEGDPQSGYEISIARDSAFSTVVFSEALPSSADSRTIAALSGGVYFWRVATRDQVDLGAWSEIRQITMDTRSTAPRLISPVPNEMIGTPLPTFRWSHVDASGNPQTAALLEISRSSGFESTIISRQVLGSASSLTLDATDSLALPNDSVLYWRVRTAGVGTDFGAPGAESSFILSVAAPNAPTSLLPENGAVTRASDLTFSWQHASSTGLRQRAFEIELSTDSAFSSSERHRGNSEAEIAVAIDDWRKRYWRLRTQDLMGWSPWSDARVFNAPVWSRARIASDIRVPVRDTFTLAIQFMMDSGSATERSGAALVSIGGVNQGVGSASGNTSLTTFSLRFDTPGVYPIVVTEDTRTSTDTLYVLARPTTSDTYIIVSGARGVGGRILADDTFLTVLLRAVAPDSSIELRIANMYDTSLADSVAPSFFDTNFVRWDSVPVTLTGGGKLTIAARRGGSIIASDQALVLARPSSGATFRESETSAASVTIELPANALDTPVWIEVRRNVADTSLEAANFAAGLLGRTFVAGSAMEIVAEDIDGNPIEEFSRDLTLRIPASAGNDLRIMFLRNGAWVLLDATSFDSTTGLASGATNHLSVWGLSVGFPGSGSVQSTQIYPNPWRSDGPTASLPSGNPAFGVKFDQLPSEAVRIRIFTITGELVLDGLITPASLGSSSANNHLQVVDVGGATGQVTRWDLKNEDGRDVASGVYIIVIQGPGGTATRKLAIIR